MMMNGAMIIAKIKEAIYCLNIYCRKEESEVVMANKKFGKICAQLCMQYAREILEEKSRPI